jgi:hypothetical protein
MGKIKRERIRNAHIREELRMEDKQNQIEGNKLRWFGHVKRMDKHRLPNRLLEEIMVLSININHQTKHKMYIITYYVSVLLTIRFLIFVRI